MVNYQLTNSYSEFQGFGQASLGRGGLILGLSQFQVTPKMLLILEVKSDLKISSCYQVFYQNP